MNPFWIAILACIILKERIQFIEIIGIVVCFGGVVMITYSKSFHEEDAKGSEDASELEKYIGMMLAILGGVSMAISNVYNRKLKDIDYNNIMVYHSMLGIILASVYILVEAIITS